MPLCDHQLQATIAAIRVADAIQIERLNPKGGRAPMSDKNGRRLTIDDDRTRIRRGSRYPGR